MTQIKQQATESNIKATTENVINDVKNSAGEVLEQAKDKVSQVADQAQKQAKTQISERKDQFANRVDSLAKALRQTSHQLQGQETGAINGYVDKAANTLSDISSHIRDNNIDQLLHQVEGFARREPAIALGSAFAIGIVAARFLKSSNQRRNKFDPQSNSGLSQYGQRASSNYADKTVHSPGNWGITGLAEES